ncbi:hypothetical protein HPB48_006172 [Haemaphysalis longicornis]|uniref:Uncharacterized protein n=1 Tax=Haemaphysalis longicornis TaxID=44386 RepID=A0A9J6GWV7_HAELO|nr:hypothetical protein HPB48_006172 [Haemaphysalis longicornis]
MFYPSGSADHYWVVGFPNNKGLIWRLPEAQLKVKCVDKDKWTCASSNALKHSSENVAGRGRSVRWVDSAPLEEQPLTHPAGSKIVDSRRGFQRYFGSSPYRPPISVGGLPSASRVAAQFGKAIGAGLKALRQEIAHLLEANEALQDENKRLTRRVDELEQYTRLNNLEIKGISSDEDPVDVVKKIGDVLKEPVSSHDIDTCHRIPTRKPGETNIVVRFVRRDKRHALLAKARKQKLTTKQLGLSQANAVYVNEHLTQANKQLLGAAIAR